MSSCLAHAWAALPGGPLRRGGHDEESHVDERGREGAAFALGPGPARCGREHGRLVAGPVVPAYRPDVWERLARSNAEAASRSSARGWATEVLAQRVQDLSGRGDLAAAVPSSPWSITSRACHVASVARRRANAWPVTGGGAGCSGFHQHYDEDRQREVAAGLDDLARAERAKHHTDDRAHHRKEPSVG